MTEAAKKKICIVSGTRADYGIFYPLLKRISEDDFFDLRLIATGMHLSSEFGLTYREIEDDGFVIDEKIEMLLSSDTEAGISKSIGLGIISFADAFKRVRPDILIVLGDRFEIFAAVISAFMARIPVAHLHGGEVTEGAMDDSLRHSITKMAYFHFTSNEVFRKRVIQLGESPDRVFNVGAMGIDNIMNMQLMSKENLEERLNFRFGRKTALVTYHPVTLENSTSENQFRELLKALNEFEDLKIIFTKPNADANGRVIISLIEEYVKNNSERAIVFSSLGKLSYLSAVNYADVVIGNSSSAIIETPSFRKPSVNIGDRQKGRIKAANIIDCNPDYINIASAVKKALSDKFIEYCLNVKNPYGDGNTAERIVGILKKKLSEQISLKKKFIDSGDIFADEDPLTTCSKTGDRDAAERYIHC